MSIFSRQLARCFLLLTSGLVASCGSSDSPSSLERVTLDVIPIPREVTRASGEFVLPPNAAVQSSSADFTARYFVELANRTRGLSLWTSDAASAPIRFEVEPDAAAQPESYSLSISSERILVTGADEAGLFYGAMTLWQLITSTSGESIRLPAVTIHDSPRFRWRGLMLDSARHFQSKAFIERFIDAMAIHKLNVLHWHLTDDQAWRLEINKYPRLTEVGAWRVPAGQAPGADIDPATNKPRLYGGFYSQSDVKDIVAYAAARHITIVPEIEMPGHASAPIAAYPTLAVSDNSRLTAHDSHPPSDWGVYQHLYNVDESTFAFLEDVLSEVVALFPGEYVHVGGDEAVKDQWKSSAQVQARMRALGVHDEHALQSYFIQRIEKFLNARGRRLVGWDEILEGGLAPNATVMSWRGIDGAIAAAQAGHDAVLSPHPTLYFDHRPFDAPVPGRGRIISTEDVYAFDPSPLNLSEAQRKHILGVQANIWTEHIRTESRVEYMTFPRAAALAEVGWSAHERRDWPDFERRLPTHLGRYRGLGIGYADAYERPSTPNRYMSHDLTLCSENIALSLEDDAPIAGERAVFLVDIMNPCWRLPNVDLSKAKHLRVSVGQVPFNFQIGADIHKIVLRRPHSAMGELEVRLGCDGERIAGLPLEIAANDHAVTELPEAKLEPRGNPVELCFQFTQAQLDPLWVINTVELLPSDTLQTAE